MEANYNLLIKKLDQFIRKYYTNEIIRGSIYSISVLLLSYLLISVSEYFNHFSPIVRGLLFYSFLLLNLTVISITILRPLLHYYKLGKVIGHDQAARIIGQHFPEVKDKLLNVLQLKSLRAVSQGNDLINASINQKIREMRPVPFVSAIDLRKNRKYAKYALGPFLIFIVILLASPNLFKDSTIRLIKHSEYFEAPKPFEFLVDPEDLKVVQYNDHVLNVQLQGKEIPSELYIQLKGSRHKLRKVNNVNFEYTFKNVQDDVDFELFGGDHNSRTYSLDVLPKPVLLNFDVQLEYPKYIGKKVEILENIGDLVIPEGTKVSWTFFSRNADKVNVFINDSSLQTDPLSDDKFAFSRKFFKNMPYLVYPSNEIVGIIDSIRYYVNVVSDKYPLINMNEFKDSVENQYLFFTGDLSDDYGLTRLSFKYSVKSNDGGKLKEDVIPIKVNSTKEQFYYTWNIKDLDFKPGDEITYYFEVWDNDGVNGRKSTKSNVRSLKMPDIEELERATEKNANNIKQNLEKTIQKAQKLRKDISDIQQKILQKKNLDWEDKNAVKDLLKKQKDLKQEIENLQQQNELYNKQQDYKQIPEDLLEKQEMLQELFEEVMTPELKELLEEMERLMEELDKEELMDKLENMDLNNEDISDQMDRMLELFKQLEFEQKLSETIDKLEKLAEEQEELSDETLDKENSTEELQKEQQEKNEEFEKIKEDLDKLQEMNKNMESPNELDDMKKEQQDIQEEMKSSEEQLQKNNRKNASEKQKNSSQKMKEMAAQMQQAMSKMQQQQQAEDMNAIRQILENLIKVSFDQEALIERTKEVKANSLGYPEIIQEQYKLKDDMKVIEDSLNALSKRQFQIKSFITKELSEIEKNLSKGLSVLEDSRSQRSESVRRRDISEAAGRQQYVMTSINNLAVMLSEVMESMQQQMAQANSMCNKPGQSQPKQGNQKMPGIRELQEQLSKQIEQMKKGKRPGQQMNEGLVKLIQKQSAIRKMIEELKKEKGKDGKNPYGDLDKIIEEMDKTEEDLANKRLTEELLERQRDIVVRLLRAEKAEKEQDMSEERKAEQVKGQKVSEPPSIEQYKKMKEKQIELYRTVPPSLKPFYKNMVEKYFNAISFKSK